MPGHEHARPGRRQTPRREGPPLRALAWIVGLGVVLRLGLLLAAGPTELQADEANYVYLGLVQQRLGVLVDPYRFLWPPLYPWLVGEALWRFGVEGLTVLKALQALACGAVGFATGVLGWRLGSARAGLVAAGLWAVHLPLAGHTHLLWSEPLFLAAFIPALERVVAALQAHDAGGAEDSARREPARHACRDGDRRADRAFLVAGLLFGASLLVKSFAFWLVPALAALAGWHVARRSGALAALRGASLLVLAPAVVTAPWTLRNLEVHGRAVPSGATLGENAFIGLNARYMNFDYAPLRRARVSRGERPIEELAWPPLVAPPEVGGRPSPGWRRPDELVHLVDKQREGLARGLDYAAAHPGWAVRTRLKHLADLATPLSFPLRHAALGAYLGALGAAPWRQLFVVGATATSLLVVFGAAVGLARGLRSAAGAIVVVPVLGYVAASALLLSMSRVRLPAEPLLIVLTALALVHGLERVASSRRERARTVAALALVALVCAALATNAREVLAVIADAWSGGDA